MKNILISVVVFYQRIFSPDKGILRQLYPFRGACVMYPSCSEYMLLAVKKYGLFKGFFLGIYRIGRCHPFQKKLIDPP
ncbi:MAG: hypothetical protein A2942_03470 [Candidatus Lloydbacteria bacterium RIFCSPLOWO2_01_FULL_50_20]|uniref:Putative membrane protein insertion efficiency factor n=1 Tax=Candidatus Lloydbacteria bacterium RIFCSPLOWO2_01_FULL_50_20 TaxID=1798665 RepID=A0A1G2DHA1_9BACT|nr:MAG: hypothetical protein A3C13_01755 [Candidatus Lloydbacteria bacterium RIFCSPHIGHO2_02_FULL_50_11]OGZ12802.1 MAG: hypothetical protein A2942_03470 [Candidatus Lloydbacteria bacterium RIFCSPLOWO2_01_FULL_50_20]